MKENVVDPRNTPAYTLVEAARYAKVPAATLRSWVVGRDYPKADGVARSRPLIQIARRTPSLLTFSNLIEAHVLRALRTEHGVALSSVRKALDYAQRELKIERLLLSEQLRTEAGRLFLERYGELIELSASGQLAMRKVFEEHLKRVDWDQVRLPARLFPFLTNFGAADERPIVIDPRIAFGRPIVASKGISTRAIADRLDAGESVEELAADYDLATEEIEKAALYERAA